MKKNLFVLAALFFSVSFCFGQAGNNQLGLGAEGDILLGSYTSFYNPGFGGNLKGLYGIGSAGQITLTAGFSSFSSKSGTLASGQTLNLIPVLAGFRYNVPNGFYGEGQAGLGDLVTKGPGFSFSQTNFAAALNVGYTTNGFDFSLRYYTEGDVISAFAIRVGYNFSLKGK